MQMIFNRLLLSFLVVVLMSPSCRSAEAEKYSTAPISNQGRKWRIGYLEAGPYINYPMNLRALTAAFVELGWMESIDLPQQQDENDTRKLWKALSKNAKSRYIEFPADAYWSCNWDDALRKKTRTEILVRLNQRKDIDLMLAMGTKAGQDLATNEHSVPTIVLSSSNPVRSGIIKGVDDSGLDHVNARVDPTRYERQIRIFHSIFGFRKLGIVYEHDTPDGKTYAAIDDVEKVAKELDFEIVSCHAPFSNVSEEEAQKAVQACHRQLAPKVDACYITVHRGVSLQNMPVLLKPFYERKIPTFSQVGSREVKHGVLMSIARADFKYIALFHAKTIARIFHGAKPRDLDQVFEDPPRIAINLKTAQMIGYDPSVDILGAADEIYETIETVKSEK
ncbi:MAG: ABC transporter substrate-binding protein [Desulfobacteraceae bacterium]|nr:MAG: ABC transporter substrate-binding protein [Desulfobacteraceae bacterium]